MNLYIVVGSDGNRLKESLEKDPSVKVVRSDVTINEAFTNITSNSAEFDVMLISDQSISSMDELVTNLNGLHELIQVDDMYKDCKVRFITKIDERKKAFHDIVGNHENFDCKLVQDKITATMLSNFCIYGNRDEDTEVPTKQENQAATDKNKQEQDQQKDKGGIIGKLDFKIPFVKKGDQNTQPEVKKDSADDVPPERKPQQEKPSEASMPKQPTRQVLKASSPTSISRVIGVTGDRGSGVTGTVANLGMLANAEGLSVCILDLDVEYKGMNLYYSKFGAEVDVKEELGHSLMRCLMQPDNFEQNSCKITDSLYVISLSHSVSPNEAFTSMDIKKVAALIGVLKLRFNVVLIDIPMSMLKRYSELILHFDRIGLCLSNDLRSIFNTVQSISYTFEDQSELSMFKAKTLAVVTKNNEANKYNGKPITSKLIMKLWSDIGDELDYNLVFAGVIPMINNYDLQLGSDKKICFSNEVIREAYISILGKLIN